MNGQVSAGQTPDRGTWEIKDGGIWMTKGTTTVQLGRVAYIPDTPAPRQWMGMVIDTDVTTEGFQRMPD